MEKTDIELALARRIKELEEELEWKTKLLEKRTLGLYAMADECNKALGKYD